MKTTSSLLLAGLLVAAQVHAADEGAKKAAAKKSAGSDKNVAQKAESNVGEFLHRNKIWVRQEKKKAK
jgi:hypothetical protein